MDKNILNDLFSGNTILQSMPGLAYVYSKEGKLLLWNKNAELVLGYSKEELYYKDISDFQVTQDRERVYKEFVKVFTKGEYRTIENTLLTKSGKKIPVLGTGSLAVVNGKEYLIGIAMDISNLKEVEEKLNAQLKEINNLKNILKTENVYLRDVIKGNYDFDEIIGESKTLLNVLYQLKQVAPTQSTVLLIGESGTKKELFARAIHRLSSRKNKPFVTINCATIPKNNMESEFFGQNKDYSIDLNQKRKGKFEIANQGTILIEEVDKIPLEMQSKLLTALQKNKFKKVGSSQYLPLDIRVIVSTNQNLAELTKKKEFLEGLFFLIHVFPITIPPLRERISDIPLMVKHLVEQFNPKFDKNIVKIPKKTISLLQNYSWPGNIRELENVIERAIILSNTSLLKVDQLVKPHLYEKEKMASLHSFERDYIIKILNMTFWRVGGEKGAAKILDMHPETLRSRMRKLKISRP